ncbi:hypothetical protein DFJ43DRAFT_1079979, partial [Lentinula guzmanii]
MVGSLNPSENIVETFHFVSIVVETIFAVIAQNFGRSIRVIPMLPNPMLPIHVPLVPVLYRATYEFRPLSFRFPAEVFGFLNFELSFIMFYILFTIFLLCFRIPRSSESPSSLTLVILMLHT